MIDETGWTEILGLRIRVIGLGEDDYAFSGNVVRLEEFTQDHFGFPIRIDVGSVKGLIVSCFACVADVECRNILTLMPLS